MNEVPTFAIEAEERAYLIEQITQLREELGPWADIGVEPCHVCGQPSTGYQYEGEVYHCTEHGGR